MNERQLFDAIGRVDDDLILAADRPAVRRRKKPVYWMPALSVAACAGLLMVGVAGWRAGSSKNDFMESAAAAAETAREAAAAPDEAMVSAATPYAEDEGTPVEGSTDGTYKAEDSTESSIAIAPAHAVMLEGVIYYDTCTVSGTDAKAAPDGTITSTVDSDSFPTEDGQSNFGTGYGYQRIDDHIEVLIDNQWIVFEQDATVPRMVMVDGKLYQETGNLPSEPFCGTPDGSITSKTANRNDVPTENNQSNFSDNRDFVFIDEDTIYVSATPDWMEFKVITDSDV